MSIHPHPFGPPTEEEESTPRRPRRLRRVATIGAVLLAGAAALAFINGRGKSKQS